jgi:uncharacterized membrane protein
MRLGLAAVINGKAALSRGRTPGEDARMRRLWLLTSALLITASAAAEKPAGKLTIVTPRPDGILAADINEGGDVIGLQWVEEADLPGVIAQKPFFARGEAMTYLPLLDGYTATFPAALSDDGLVVGRASKPAQPGRHVPLQSQAFVWHAESGIKGLGVLEGDNGSFACGISRDGKRISGASIGEDGIKACVWEREGDGWKISALPHAVRLGSNVVAVSGDGTLLSAVDGTSACLWSRNDSGNWNRETIAEAAQLIPRAVNDDGMVVGVRNTPDGLVHAVVWTKADGVRVLDKPPGFVKSEALAVNSAGVVVGSLDGPNGSPIGPNGFAFSGDEVRLLTQENLSFTGATGINDRGQVVGIIEKEEDEAKPDDQKPPPR